MIETINASGYSKEDLHQLYINLYNDLSSHLHKLNNIDKKTVELIAKIALKTLKLPDVEIYLDNNLEKNNGIISDNKITISTKTLKSKSFYEVCNTIFHEMCHFNQHYTISKKTINKNMEAGMPFILFSPEFTVLTESSNIEIFSLYKTNKLEKEARDFALSTSHELIEIMQKINTNDKKMSKFLNFQQKKIENAIQEEKKEFLTHMQFINLGKENYCYVSRVFVSNFLSKINTKDSLSSTQNMYYKQLLIATLYLYNDDNIINKLLDFAFKNNDKEFASDILNCPSTIINEQQFKDYCLFCKFDDLETIKQQLGNWNPCTLKIEFEKQKNNNQIKITEETKE